MQVQMRDVAERAGVSITTVSHIVNSTRPVAPETRERVLRAMDELRYYKNAFGRRLARGRSDTFGLIVSDIENQFFPELIKSFEEAVIGRGCDVLLMSTNYDAERAQMAVHRMIENKVQGVAVMTSQLDAALVEELLEADLPVVRLDGGEVKRGLSEVRVDYSPGAHELAGHLKELGHARAAYISGPHSRVSSIRYESSFFAALRDLGMPEPQIVEGDHRMEGGWNGVRALLEAGELPTAFVCGNDVMAIGAIKALTAAGIRVPEQVSVVGADDIPFARYAIPALTTMRIARDELGRLAFEALDKSMKSKKRSGASYSVETRLVKRESTGRAFEGEVRAKVGIGEIGVD
jgi:LacI family transcriptional regulator